MKAYEPLELAKLLKELRSTACEIALELKDINVRHKAVTTGAILLNKEIFPNMREEEMRTVLEAVFPNENINQAMDILYPKIMFIKSNEKGNDTGIDLYDNEVLSVIIPPQFCSQKIQIQCYKSPNNGKIMYTSSRCLYVEIRKITQNTLPHMIGRLVLNKQPERKCPPYLMSNCRNYPWIIVEIEKELVS